MSERLDTVGVKSEIIKVGDLQRVNVILHGRRSSEASAYVFQLLHMFGMLVGYVLLHERCRFEKLLTSLTAEFAFIFLLDEWLDCFSQFPGNERHVRKA